MIKYSSWLGETLPLALPFGRPLLAATRCGCSTAKRGTWLQRGFGHSRSWSPRSLLAPHKHLLSGIWRRSIAFSCLGICGGFPYFAIHPIKSQKQFLLPSGLGHDLLWTTECRWRDDMQVPSPGLKSSGKLLLSLPEP